LSYGTVNQTTGAWREQPSVDEYFAEAYSRYLLQPTNICRAERTITATVNGAPMSVDVPSTMPAGENVGTCSARVRRDLGWLFADGTAAP
jgi:hypothetical protein